MSATTLQAALAVVAKRMANAYATARSDAAQRAVYEAIDALVTPSDKPIDMVLHCPACGEQHIDASEPNDAELDKGFTNGWGNPPHRSHLCHACGHIWRPADVPTNGVVEVKTQGKNDSPITGLAGALKQHWQDGYDDAVRNFAPSEAAFHKQLKATPGMTKRLQGYVMGAFRFARGTKP